MNDAYINRLELLNITFSRVNKTSSEKVNLRGCLIENFTGTNEDNLKLLQAQMPEYFSREPYIQLENYYSKIGDETEAERIYLKGRDTVRRHAMRKNTSIQWPWTKKLSDLFLNILVRYGTRSRRLLIPIILLLIVGLFFVYRADNSLTLINDPNMTVPTFSQKLFYLVDLLIPVDLNVAENWQPSNFMGEICATGLIIFGWLLVPLLIASLSGILRRQ